MNQLLPALLLLLPLALVGCGGSGEPDKEQEKDAKTKAEAASGEQLDLAHLSPEDQALALKQKICPVGGELLGSGGMKTVKISVDGRDVFLCCEGCESAIRDEPAKYFAILDGKQNEPAEGTQP